MHSYSGHIYSDPDFSRILHTTSSQISVSAIENILSILERLTGIPSSSSQIGNWWVEAFARRPTSKSSQEDSGPDNESKAFQDDDEDDWRKFFEEPSTTDDIDSKTSSSRLHTLSVHQHLHSVASHKAMFTRVWLSLLSRLSSVSADRSQAIAFRILDIMHGDILPHLTRPVLVMDWVGSCVDYGTYSSIRCLDMWFDITD